MIRVSTRSQQGELKATRRLFLVSGYTLPLCVC